MVDGEGGFSSFGLTRLLALALAGCARPDIEIRPRGLERGTFSGRWPAASGAWQILVRPVRLIARSALLPR